MKFVHFLKKDKKRFQTMRHNRLESFFMENTVILKNR